MKRLGQPALLLFLLTWSPLFSESKSDPFPVPEIVQPNVLFWKKIYSEVSLKQGLLHDRDYPKIIYETVDVGNRTGSERSAHIDARKNVYAEIISVIRTSPDSALNERQRIVKKLFITHASESALVDAENRIRFQQGQKERFQLGIERSYLHLDTIVSILKSYGVPLRLKYLPHVESSFDPFAYSRVGAAGLWQFMPGTGRMFMKVDYAIDERLDPIRSTVAAAKLLKGNYEKLKSWPLAITAYNHGLGGMQRAVASTGSNDIAVIIQKHESPSFKFASRNFYACFIAASDLADSAEVYFPGHARKEPFRAKTFTVSSATKPATLIKQLGISEEVFKSLNPSLRPVVFKQQRPIPGGFVLNLPISVSQPAMVAAAALPAEPESSEYYTVARGDNLAGIARRHGVSLQELAQLNNIDKVHRIFEGQVLRLPGSAKDEKTPAIASAALSAVGEARSGDTVPSGTKHSSAAQPEKPKIAPVPATVQTPVALAKSPDPGSESGDDRNGFDAGAYELGLEVTPGASSAKLRVSFDETIGRYAEWMNVSPESILRLNELRSPNLRLNQTILIPIGPRSDLKNFEVRRLEYHMALEEDFWSRYRVNGTRSLTIRSGDNLWRIAKQEQIPMWLLYRYNRLTDFASPKPGTKIRIPVLVEKSAHVAPSLIDAQTDTVPILSPGSADLEAEPRLE